MEARDGSGRIRPLPPVEPEAAAAGATGQPEPADRRWVPLAVAGVALLFFAVLAGSFATAPPAADEAAGAGATDAGPAGLGASPSSSTTTAPPVPVLDDLVPGLDRELVVVYRPDDESLIGQVIWNRSSAAPGTQTLTGAAATAAAFDTSRRGLLALTEGQTTTLWTGRPPVTQPVFIDVHGAAWHSTEPMALSFVGRPPGGDGYHLFTARARTDGGITDLADLGEVPGASRLVGWGDWGFALSRLPAPFLRHWEVPNPEDPAGPTIEATLHVTILVSPDGQILRSVPAVPHAVGPGGELAISPTDAAYEAALAAGHAPEDLGLVGDVTKVMSDASDAEAGLVAGSTSETVLVVGPDLTPTGVSIRMAAPTTTYAFVPGGTHVAAIGGGGARLLVYVEALDGSGERRLSSVEGAHTLIGFSRNGEYLIAHELGTGDLVFLDWDRGVAAPVPFELGRVLAIDV